MSKERYAKGSGPERERTPRAGCPFSRTLRVKGDELEYTVDGHEHANTGLDL